MVCYKSSIHLFYLYLGAHITYTMWSCILKYDVSKTNAKHKGSMSTSKHWRGVYNIVGFGSCCYRWEDNTSLLCPLHNSCRGFSSNLNSSQELEFCMNWSKYFGALFFNSWLSLICVLVSISLNDLLPWQHKIQFTGSWLDIWLNKEMYI